MLPGSQQWLLNLADMLDGLEREEVEGQTCLVLADEHARRITARLREMATGQAHSEQGRSEVKRFGRVMDDGERQALMKAEEMSR